jgi:hypothetical protein
VAGDASTTLTPRRAAAGTTGFGLKRIERINRIVRTGETVCPPRPKKALLLGQHRRSLAPRGAIRAIRFIRSNPHPVFRSA